MSLMPPTDFHCYAVPIELQPCPYCSGTGLNATNGFTIFADPECFFCDGAKFIHIHKMPRKFTRAAAKAAKPKED